MEIAAAIREVADREIAAVLVGVSIVAVALLPTNAGALSAWFVVIAAGVLVALARPRATAAVSRLTLMLLACGGAAVALAIATSLTATNRRVSLVGVIGQHTGSLLWVGLFVLLACMIVRGRKGDVGRTARSIAIGAAVVGLTAVLDVAGIAWASVYSPEASGIMESSISLAQVLVIGLGCALGWATARQGGERYLALVCAAVCATGILAAGARSAELAIAIAAVVFGTAILAAKRAPVRSVVWAAALTALALATLGAAWVAFGDVPAGGTESATADLITDRDVIWRSAFAQAAEDPVLGSGAEQFSAWVTWDSVPAGGFTKTGTYDPHNVMLWWLLGTGWIGLALALSAGFFALERMFSAFAASGSGTAVAAMAGGVVAWVATIMFGWVSPLAALLATLILAALVSAADNAAGERGVSAPAWTAWVSAGVAAALVAVAVPLSAASASAEYSWARMADRGASDANVLSSLARDSNDPSLAAAAVSAVWATSSGDIAITLQRLEPLASIVDRDASWHVDAAFSSYQISAARVAISPGGAAWGVAEEAIAAGKSADPASGLWDYVAATQASQFGFEGSARQHAQAALELPLPDGVRAFLEPMADPQ